jgi:hypothetical protein
MKMARGPTGPTAEWMDQTVNAEYGLTERCLFCLVILIAAGNAQNLNLGNSRGGQQPSVSRPWLIADITSLRPDGRVCSLIHSNGQYRRELTLVSAGAVAKPQIYEAWLSDGDLEELQKILNDPAFQSLPVPPIGWHSTIRGEVFVITVPRMIRPQTYITADVSTQRPPAPVQALLQWLRQMDHKTRKQKNASPQCVTHTNAVGH